jgi:hypothetical protein
MKVTLGYNEQFTSSSGSGSSDGYVINLQSMFDPRFAAGGHQPQYFDQLMVLFTYFVVRRATLRVVVIPDHDVMTSGTGSNTSVYQTAALVVPFTNTSGTRASAAASDMLEWPGALVAPAGTNGGGASIVLKIDIPKLTGIPWQAMRNNPAFWGTNGGNPSTMIAYAWVGAIAQGAGAPTPSLVQATIEFEAELFVPQTIATS